MKQEELMVNDWILHEGEPYQIRQLGIYGEDRDGKDYPAVCVGKPNGFGLVVDRNEIEPIPLTPEILEKNGFKRDPLWHHCDKDLDNYSISVQLGYANRIEYIKIAEKGKENVIPSERTKMYLTHIKYLHQLQHALRLCGIEKEIEL
jgi:hypothetical protein